LISFREVAVNENGPVLQLVSEVRNWLSGMLPAELLGWLGGNEWALWVAAGLLVLIAVATLSRAFGD
jgi:hypothetical protein